MHGRIRTTPAEHLQADGVWDGDSYVLRVGGEMREGELFGENMILRRSIETRYGEMSVTVTDRIENQSYRPEPLMLLYHINIGYPLLDEGTEVLAPTRFVKARDKVSEGQESDWNRMDAPKDNEPEYVFIHDLARTEEDRTVVCVLNEKLSLGLKLAFSCKNLPYFMEWKSTASGDYVLGLEPANSSVYGRPFHEKEGTLHCLPSFKTETNVLKFSVLDGKEALEAARKEVADILAQK